MRVISLMFGKFGPFLFVCGWVFAGGNPLKQLIQNSFYIRFY